MSTMPAYYTEMIEHAVHKTAVKQNDQSLNFIFITDPHHTLGGNQIFAAQAIQRLAETLPLDFI
ncbi:hypothetical protein GNF83_21125, partial [Clostridium perfringens]|nr:hypothetical protein [Clostridium perfringens]